MLPYNRNYCKIQHIKYSRLNINLSYLFILLSYFLFLDTSLMCGSTQTQSNLINVFFLHMSHVTNAPPEILFNLVVSIMLVHKEHLYSDLWKITKKSLMLFQLRMPRLIIVTIVKIYIYYSWNCCYQEFAEISKCAYFLQWLSLYNLIQTE